MTALVPLQSFGVFVGPAIVSMPSIAGGADVPCMHSQLGMDTREVGGSLQTFHNGKHSPWPLAAWP